jgi:hypothetical protein
MITKHDKTEQKILTILFVLPVTQDIEIKQLFFFLFFFSATQFFNQLWPEYIEEITCPTTTQIFLPGCSTGNMKVCLCYAVQRNGIFPSTQYGERSTSRRYASFCTNLSTSCLKYKTHFFVILQFLRSCMSCEYCLSSSLIACFLIVHLRL